MNFVFPIRVIVDCHLLRMSMIDILIVMGLGLVRRPGSISSVCVRHLGDIFHTTSNVHELSCTHEHSADQSSMCTMQTRQLTRRCRVPCMFTYRQPTFFRWPHKHGVRSRGSLSGNCTSTPCSEFQRDIYIWYRPFPTVTDQRV